MKSTRCNPDVFPPHLGSSGGDSSRYTRAEDNGVDSPQAPELFSGRPRSKEGSGTCWFLREDSVSRRRWRFQEERRIKAETGGEGTRTVTVCGCPFQGSTMSSHCLPSTPPSLAIFHPLNSPCSVSHRAFAYIAYASVWIFWKLKSNLSYSKQTHLTFLTGLIPFLRMGIEYLSNTHRSYNFISFVGVFG